MTAPSPLTPEFLEVDSIYRSLRARGAPGWDDEELYRSMLARLVRDLPPTPARVLELGCGAGNLSLLLAGLGHEVTGVDGAPAAIAWARDRAQRAPVRPRFIVDDVRALALCSDASFDSVVDGHCFHCLMGADRERCLAAVARVLVPGGRLIIQSMCGELAQRKANETLGYDPHSGIVSRAGRPFRTLRPSASLIAEVSAAGFALCAQEVIAPTRPEDQEELFAVFTLGVRRGA